MNIFSTSRYIHEQDDGFWNSGLLIRTKLHPHPENTAHAEYQI